MTNKDAILQKLITLQPELEMFGIARIGLFGSYARGNPRPDSDIDLLVEFINTPGLLELAELHDKLERSFNCRVDIATTDMLRSDYKDDVLDEVVYHD